MLVTGVSGLVARATRWRGEAGDSRDLGLDVRAGRGLTAGGRVGR